MIWILAGVTTVLSCELFCRFPIIKGILEIKLVTSKTIKVLNSNSISDHWKEWILPRYAVRILKYSILSFIYLVIALSPFLLCGITADYIDFDFLNFVSKPLVILGITLFAWIYMVIRKNWSYLFASKKSNYNFTSKLLHHLALNSRTRGSMLFDIEKLIFSRMMRPCSEDHHVFVCGLARSGTTVLMRALHESGDFASLTYRDMPFVLALNSWAKITSNNSKSIQKSVRAHDDGLLVDFDSPEALEEVFWGVFAGNDYIHANHLTPHRIDDDVITGFQEYVGLINLRYSKNRYLSKNNNNILRLDGICEAFPKAKVLIPFREPLQHAFSLLKQHKNFVAQHSEDAFSKKYMSWLVHHEFGLDYRPFRFGNEICPQKDLSSIDYWLCVWINAYTYFLKHIKNSSGKLYFVCYESICQNDRYVWQTLADLVKIPKENDFEFILKRVTTSIPQNDDLRKKASAIYNELLTESEKQLGIMRG